LVDDLQRPQDPELDQALDPHRQRYRFAPQLGAFLGDAFTDP
jgi:hypothetical protein